MSASHVTDHITLVPILFSLFNESVTKPNSGIVLVISILLTSIPGFLNLFSLEKEDEKESLFAGFLNSFSLKEDEKESELIITIKRSILLIQKEEFKKAEQMLHLALKLAQQQQNDQAVTYIHDLMANLAYDTEDLSKAETLFVNVLQRLIASGAQQDDNRVLHISYKMADIYKKMGDIE
uniref:MalT-like TPR region domain-containing protein n=1 Tax=Timema genevievae TaxID=629358 RepID=A0A7R9K3U6_TIMGE|nr:unnamed protein product [Timema genevievae]